MGNGTGYRRQRYAEHKRPDKKSGNKQQYEEPVPRQQNSSIIKSQPIDNFWQDLAMRWSRMSFYEKCGVTVLILAGAGLSIFIISKILPGIVIHFDSIFKNTNAPRQSNYLNQTRIQFFRQKEFNPKIVKIDPRLEKHAQGKKALQDAVSVFRQRVKEVTKNTIVTEQQRKVFKQKKFRISITHKEFIDNSDAAFYDSTNHVYVSFKPNATYEELQRAIMNELHHAQIYEHNKKNGCNPKIDERLMGEPFCGSDGNVDQELAVRLFEAIDQDHTAVSNFYKNYLKFRKGKLSSYDEKIFLNELELIDSYFSPQEKIKVVKLVEYESYVKPLLEETNNPDVPYRIPSHKLNLPVKVPGDLCFLSINQEGDYMEMRYRYALDATSKDEKAKAFISEWLLTNNMSRSKNFSYAQKGLSKESIVAEIASFIEEYPSEIKEHFFKGFCEFFSDFFNRERYCYHLRP